MRQYRFCRTILGLACGLLIAVAGESAQADSLVLQLSTSINGSPPVETTPWVKADFESTTAGTVTLTITSYLQKGEFLPVVLFNTNPSVDPTNLTITNTGGTAGSPSSIKTGDNLYDGGSQIKGGLFDIQLSWGTNVFAGGDTAIFTIKDTADSITAATFDAFSTSEKNSSTYLAAADVRGIPQSGGQTTSGSIGTQTAAVPEPSSAILALFGLGGASSLAWSRRRKSS